MEKTKTLLWLILTLCSFAATAVPTVNNIKYQGNEVTQASVLDRELYIRPGDELSVNLIEKSRQAIMDLGLFVSVNYYLEEDYTGDENEYADSRIDVVFVMEEKYYLLIVPRLKIDDNEAHYGLQLKWDNVFGLNHETRILIEDRGSTNDVDEDRYSFKYYYPNVNGSLFSVDLLIQKENDVDDSEGIIDRQDDLFRFSISRWLNAKGKNRGWFVGGNILYQKRINKNLIEVLDSESLDAIVLGVNTGYKNLSNFEYNRGGKDYGYQLNFSHESFGSETDFVKHLFYYRSYYRFKNYPLSNLNVQMQFGHSNNNVLGEEAFSLGGGSDLRGYENSRFEGNTMFLSNIEYMFPEKDNPVIRYVTFIDVGNTYKGLSDVLHSALNVGAGFGLRWKIQAFVNIDLRADVGYGFTDEDYQFGFGTRHAF